MVYMVRSGDFSISVTIASTWPIFLMLLPRLSVDNDNDDMLSDSFVVHGMHNLEKLNRCPSIDVYLSDVAGVLSDLLPSTSSIRHLLSVTRGCTGMLLRLRFRGCTGRLLA